MSDWRIFQGDHPEEPQPQRLKLPDAPPWRPSGATETRSLEATETRALDRLKQRGKTYRAQQEGERELVNAALYLRRPLLITGAPGVGKSSLAYAVAYELGLGEVLYWSITTRTTLQDGLYTYDAIGRLQDPNTDAKDLSNIGKYIQLGPLGTALLPAKRPRVLLIDEIDKGDIDLPNDLLCVFEDGGFNIKELTRLKQELPEVEVQTAYTSGDEQTAWIKHGRVDCGEFPFIVLTSNGERDFPAPFLRRCLRLSMKEPDVAMLEKIVESHLEEVNADIRQLIQDFYELRGEVSDRGQLATDQLLNAVYLITRGAIPQGEQREALLQQLLKPLSSSEDS
jgi:MoxR-like ATPase